MREYLKRQKKLFKSEEREKMAALNVMVAGTGGLGTNLAIQLQRIGVNKIYLYDYDKVEISNLNRQLCFGRDDIGKAKVEQAAEFLNQFKLDTEIIAKNEKITEDMELADDIHIIFDALDNFETRFVVDKLAQKYELPFIHAGVEDLFAQIMLILPESKSRLNDVFAGAEKDDTPAVFSPAVTITASFQLIEALKYLLGRDNYLKDTILHIDLFNSEIEKIELR